MTMYDLDAFRRRVADWLFNRQIVASKVDPKNEEWERSDDEAADIVRALAALLGIDCDDLWTVTVAGGERHDGEAPYTYLVQAADVDAAQTLALEWHGRANEEDDVILVECHQGVPAGDYAWDDLRGKTIDDAVPLDVVAELQRQQQIIEAVRLEQATRGWPVPNSGDYGYEPWARRVLSEAGEADIILNGRRRPLG